MKKFWNLYIDDFMLEKEISQWIWERMIEKYHTVFNLFITSEHTITSDLSTYTSQNFKRFLWENLIKKNWASATYNSYRKYLRCYCEFLKTEWYLIENPFDKIKKRKTPVQLPKTLTKNEVKELLDNLDNAFDNSTFIWKRNKTIVYTYLYSGLRLSELLNLKLEHLQIYDWYIKVVKWKWGKDRIVPLSKEISKIISVYLKDRKKDFSLNGDSFLFPTVYWNSLQKRDMRFMINKLRKCITFHFTWHQLRHTFATELVRNNFDIYNISRILWHSKIDTTKIYLSVDTWKLKKQLDSINLFA